MNRSNYLTALIGRRKAGKTTLGRQIINSTKFDKILLIDTFEHPDYKDFQTIDKSMLSRWIKGKKRLLVTDQNDEVFEEINRSVKNTLIVCEDCTKYIQKTLSKSLTGMVFDSKQKNNDILFMYHGFSFIPQAILANVNFITLFKVGENISKYSGKIPNFEEIEAKHHELQANQNPYIHHTFLVN